MARTAALPAALLLAALVALQQPRLGAAGSCTHLNNCNGHGTCDSVNSRCICFNGYGSPTDVALYKAPDCSTREWACCSFSAGPRALPARRR